MERCTHGENNPVIGASAAWQQHGAKDEIHQEASRKMRCNRSGNTIFNRRGNSIHATKIGVLFLASASAWIRRMAGQ
jgi:hypothetical protein